MLQIDNLHAAYGRSHILQGISLQVKKGELLVLLGRNGAGKTTLLKTVMGYVPAQHGRIHLAGQPIHGTATHKIAQAGVGYVPQGRGIFPTLTVQQQLSLAARNPTGQGWTLARTLSTFPALQARLHHLGQALSGGEQQMVALARALMTNPRLLLLDEPSEGLAPLIVQQMGQLLRQLADEGLAILLVEQHVRFALSIADRVHLLNKGQLVFGGSPADLAAQPAIQQQFLGV